ncbi:MAG: DUF1015 domain-containing protein [Candidatus Aminicenantes bacterium]|nr:DUF1015 domain-containing protein [Candidatus Aminicenantes bacterium]
MRTFPAIGLGVPEILLPPPGTDLSKWAVIACDQYTSEPEYWDRAAAFVGDAPSSLRLIFPEVYLTAPDAEARIAGIRKSMDALIAQNFFEAAEGFVYVERKTGSGARQGLVVCLDLEAYDFRKGSAGLIRATEGTIIERIPPRVKIRDGAPLEIPHIMVLIDDPEGSVLGPLGRSKNDLTLLYDFELMMGSGRLAGYRVPPGPLEETVTEALASLARPEAFASRYGLSPGTPVLLYAMGDGNHSLATAKAIWDKTKAEGPAAPASSPLRYALVELVNLHDPSLVFEPIHRLVFEIAPGRNLLEEIHAFYGGHCRYSPSGGFRAMRDEVDRQRGRPHKIGIVAAGGSGILEVAAEGSNLPVGTLQTFLDAFMKTGGAREIDYVHGTEALETLGEKAGNLGFYLPAMPKDGLFKTVILDGALPRKTFSMGKAWEKRFYMEARRLS